MVFVFDRIAIIDGVVASAIWGMLRARYTHGAKGIGLKMLKWGGGVWVEGLWRRLMSLEVEDDEGVDFKLKSDQSL